MNTKRYILRPSDALMRIDLQNTFGLETGGLYVPGGSEIVPEINALSRRFLAARATVGDSQDWHPANHSSFASNNPGNAPFSVIQTSNGPQVMWTDHGIEGTDDAAFLSALDTDAADFVIRKGRNRDIDSYSAFNDNAADASTGLAGLLRARGVSTVFFVGLAYDFCVGWSALDAVKEGFEAVVLKDLTRAVNMPTEGGSTSVRDIEAQFDRFGVHVITSDQITI
jgi:nicotinamidase/pyrazinamidase